MNRKGPDALAHGGGRRDSEHVSSDRHALPPTEQQTFPTDPAEMDAAGQFVRRKATEVKKGLDGLHSANPKATSGDGDATQPIKHKSRQPRPSR